MKGLFMNHYKNVFKQLDLKINNVEGESGRMIYEI